MNNRIYKLAAVLLWFLPAVLLCPKAVADVSNDFGVWGAVQGQGRLALFQSDEKSPWRWWMEGQGRFNDDAGRLGQSIIRPGLGYQLSDHLSVWLGYGWINTIPLGKQETDEHRIWQQLSWQDTYAWGEMSSRTRLEQRFLNNGDDTGWRFRQLLKYTHPFYIQRIYLSLWDEVFVNINSTDWGEDSGFGQNRLFAGFGVFIDADRHYRFELGYLNQFVYHQNSNDQMNHIISGSLFIRY